MAKLREMSIRSMCLMLVRYPGLVRCEGTVHIIMNGEQRVRMWPSYACRMDVCILVHDAEYVERFYFEKCRANRLVLFGHVGIAVSICSIE